MSYSHERACKALYVWPCPLGPLGGVNGQISLNFNYKVNFKDFYTKVCFPTKERYKTYQMGFCRLGHALRVGLGVLRRQILNSVCRTVMLTSSKPSDEIQPNLVCEPLTCGACNRANCYGSKGQITLNLNYKVMTKTLIPNFVCVLTNKKI